MSQPMRKRDAVRELELHIDSLEIPESVAARLREAVQVLGPHKRVKKDRGVKGTTRAQRKASTSAAERKVYAAVAARDLVCQVMSISLGPCSGELEIDHQWGRGKAPTTAQNCRRLCHHHHQEMKHAGDPSRLAWLKDFRWWALSKGFWIEDEKALRAIAYEEAQHPARAQHSEEG